MAGRADLRNPATQALVRDLAARSQVVARAADRFRDAVRPLFALRHPDSARSPQQLGSGVLVQLAGEIFMLSAAHVFEHFGAWPILMGFGEQLFPVRGERYSSLPGRSGTHGDDSVDAAAFHIHLPDAPADLSRASLTVHDIDFTVPAPGEDFRALIGYRLRKFKKGAKGLESLQQILTSIEFDRAHYRRARIDPARYLAAVWEPKVPAGRIYEIAPIPRGMSGGAMLNVHGLRLAGINSDQEAAAKLAAIFIECRKPEGNKPGVLLGTRIASHLGLIANYHPDVGDWLRANVEPQHQR